MPTANHVEITISVAEESLARATTIATRAGLSMEVVLPRLIEALAAGELPDSILQPLRTPFDTYDDFLERDLAHLDAEAALFELTRGIADRARAIATELRRAKPDRERIKAWQSEMTEALEARGTLNPGDASVLRQATDRFPRLAND